jgi:hypothetical protein
MGLLLGAPLHAAHVQSMASMGAAPDFHALVCAPRQLEAMRIAEMYLPGMVCLTPQSVKGKLEEI